RASPRQSPLVSFLMLRRPPTSPLFPYTTLFRSAEAPQARVARLWHVLGAAVHAHAAVGVPHVAELGGEHHLVSPAQDRPAHEVLVVAPAVHVGGVEEVDTEVEGVVDDSYRLDVVALAGDGGHG